MHRKLFLYFYCNIYTELKKGVKRSNAQKAMHVWFGNWQEYFVSFCFSFLQIVLISYIPTSFKRAFLLHNQVSKSQILK